MLAVFCGYVEQICAMQAADRGFTMVLTWTFPAAKRFEADRDRAFVDFAGLLTGRRPPADSALTSSPKTCPLFLMANAGVLTATADAAPGAWRRLVSYLHPGLRRQPPPNLCPTLLHPAGCTGPCSAPADRAQIPTFGRPGWPLTRCRSR